LINKGRIRIIGTKYGSHISDHSVKGSDLYNKASAANLLIFSHNAKISNAALFSATFLEHEIEVSEYGTFTMRYLSGFTLRNKLEVSEWVYQDEPEVSEWVYLEDELEVSEWDPEHCLKVIEAVFRIPIRPDTILFGLKDPDPKLLILCPNPAPDLDPPLLHTK